VVTQAPDKTFIGRIDKEFDFLGYRFRENTLAVAEKTIFIAVNNIIRHAFYIKRKQKQTTPKRAVLLEN
jgi:hypothetical protein